MSDVPRLLAAFDDGSLIRPSADVPNTVDLARAVASLCGATDLDLNVAARDLAQGIGDHDHIVFVLVDGLGMHLVDQEERDSVIRANNKATLHAVFPTSTAPSLTSIATGEWPATHAIPGWFTYIPDAKITATILPFVERFSKEDARKHGLTVEGAFPTPALGARMTRTHLRVVPKHINGSVYSLYSSSGAPSIGYSSLRAGVNAVIDAIATAKAPSYTYLYIPFVDTAQHERGIDSKSTRRAMKLVRSRLEMLAEGIRGRSRIVLTADHGQIEIEDARQTILAHDDPMLDMLRVAPSCEPRVPAFHVKPGMSSQFEDVFRARFGDRFALLTIDEADDLRFFGPQPLSAEMRRRLGDYVGIALDADMVSLPLERPMLGFHGGLMPDEVRVPLVII